MKVSSNRGIKSGKKFSWNLLTIILLTSVLFIFLSLTKETFFTYNNVYSILYGVSINFFVVIGFTLLMIMGEIDLSVGSMFAFSGMFVGIMVIKLGIPLVLAIIISLIVCAAWGAFTGFLVAKYKVSSMMITIATMTLLRGVASLFVSELYGVIYTSEYRHVSKIQIGSVFITVIIMIVAVIVLEILLNKTAVFRKLYYIGENLTTARIYGIRAERTKIIVFAVSAFTAAIGGILAGSRVTYADASLGMGLEFHVLTATVLGGASLFGGKGSILRSTIGLVFLSMITTGLIIYNIDPLLQSLIIGAILIISVYIDTKLSRTDEK